MTTAIATPDRPRRPDNGACADRPHIVAPRHPDEPAAAYVARTLRARQYCATCPVRIACAATANRHRSTVAGMWAGRNHGHGMSQHHDSFNGRRAS